MSNSDSTPAHLASPALSSGSANGHISPSTSPLPEHSPTPPPLPPPKAFRASSSPLMADTLSSSSPAASASSPSPSQNGSPQPAESSSMSPSRSWQRINTQQPFVNGRGNVQLPAAPRQFVPSPSGSLTSSPALSQHGSPSLGVQREGHQAYVRREPSPGPSSRTGDGQDGASATTYLPSQFGVRQRVAIRQSSRPSAPRSAISQTGSLGAGRRTSTASSMSGTYETGGLASPTLGKTEELPPIPPSTAANGHDRGRTPSQPASPTVSTAIPFTPSDQHLSPSSHLPPAFPRSIADSPSASVSPSPATLSPTPSRDLSPSPALSASSHRSVLDRPRPRTPDPFGTTGEGASFSSRGGIHAPRPSLPTTIPSFTTAASSHSPSPSNDHSRLSTFSTVSAVSTSTARSRSTSPVLSRSVPPSFASPSPSSDAALPPPAKTRVLDRPRPKTPDAGAMFRFGESSSTTSAASGGFPYSSPTGSAVGGGGGGGPYGSERSVLGRTSEAGAGGGVFSFEIPPLAREGSGGGVREDGRRPSVMDRPRPKTPDAQGWLDSYPSALGASIGSNHTVRASQIPLPPGSGASSRTTSPVVERRMYAAGGGAGRQQSGSTSSFGTASRAGNASQDSLVPRGLPTSGSGLSASSSSASASAWANSPARPSFDYSSATTYPSSTSNPSSSSFSSPARTLFTGVGVTGDGAARFSTASSSSFVTAPPHASSSSSALNLSSASTSSSGHSSSETPLLSLDFDFGGSPFGSSDTMFGLSDLLKFGGSGSGGGAKSPRTPKTATPSKSPLSNGDGFGYAFGGGGGLLSPKRDGADDEATTPTPTSERKDFSTAVSGSSPSAPTTPSASSSSQHNCLVTGSSSNGRSTPRKEPPRVDSMLERELEAERAQQQSDGDEDRSKRLRRTRDDEDEGDGEEIGATKQMLVREQPSMSSLGSFSAPRTSTSDASIYSTASGGLGHSPQGPKRRRRRSLASLLSIGGSSLLGGGGKGKEKEREEGGRASMSRSGTPEPGLRSFTPEPMRAYTPEPGLSSLSLAQPCTSQQQQQQQQPAPLIAAPPTLAHFAPRLSLDKSLPPTPLSPSPAVDPSPPQSSAGDHLQPDSASFASSTKSGAIGRSLSRLRNRSVPTPISVPPRVAQPAFQVVSATTTRKTRHNVNNESISSIATGESMGMGRRGSIETGAYGGGLVDGPFHALPPHLHQPQQGYPPLAPASAPVPAASSALPPSQPAPATVPFGRRFVERFTKPTAKPPASTWTAPVKDHSASSSADAHNGGPRLGHGRRRSSLSSLLGVTGSVEKTSLDGSAPAPKKLLGMSLPAGRKSEDLLTSGRGREREMRREWESPNLAAGSRTEGGVDEKMNKEVAGRRRSFDLLTEKDTISRRPSTDDLLTLATQQLSALAVEEPPLTASTIAPPLSAEDSTFSHEGSSLASGQSTPSDEIAGKASAVVAHATLINRSDASTSSPSAPPAGSDPDVPLYGTRTAAPVLLRSDSLRTGAGKVHADVRPSPPIGSSTGGTASSEGVEGSPNTATSSAVWRKKHAKVADSGVGSDASMSNAWLDLEDALSLYSLAVRENKQDRGAIITTTLLPFLRREEDNPASRVNETLAQRQRDILFGWLSTLTNELRELQPAHRGACLEAVAAIAESHFLAAGTLQDDPAGQARYRTAVVQILDFAVDKLNDKAVYANTLVFSGRVFALAFFRIEGVALKLLRALPPVKRQGLTRILDEAGVKEFSLPPAELDAFPEHLWSLCLRDFRTYTTLLLPPKTAVPNPDDRFLVRDGEVEVEMSGNWLIRWTASDSDLPFAFYRAYHRQLASHLIPFEARPDIVGQPPLPPSAIITAPGFLFLAASLLDKSDSLVHRNLRSVTSIGPNSGNFNTNDSANLSFGQKPKVLELAHRRVVQTMLDVVGGPPTPPGSDTEAAPDAEARRHVFSGMLQVWLRACVKRTSMWDTRSVFILLDLFEGLFYTLSYPAPAARGSEEDDAPTPKPDEASLLLFDLPFIFDFVRIILTKADNTVTLMKAISFLYSHFEIFTLRLSDRTELCEKTILDQELFQRLFLHWNSGVRGYFIRLLVWRLSRLGVVAQEQNPHLPPDQGIIAIFNLLNVRLEALRKRHDALEPLDTLIDEDVYFRPKRSTICSTRGVKEAPWTVDELAEPFDEEEEEGEEEPQELVRALPPPPASAASGMSGTSSTKGDRKTVSKVVSWLKGGLKKQGKGSKGVSPLPDQHVEPFALERGETVQTRRQDSLGAVTIDDDNISAETQSQDWPSAPLPTTVETGIVPSQDPPGPHTPPAPVEAPRQDTLLVPPPTSPPQRTKSSRSEKRSSRSLSPAFFSFEFENGVVTRSDVDPSVAAASSSSSSVVTTGSNDTNFPTSPIRARHGVDAAVSHRVSLRFSKRISILPPAALDLLKEATGANGRGVEAVPPIPAQYRQAAHVGYEKRFHPYAVRGLRDYEDALDEWTDWVARLQEEEDNGGKLTKTFVDVVPRLAVNWPLGQGED